jgi:hypothetical protein
MAVTPIQAGQGAIPVITRQTTPPRNAMSAMTDATEIQVMYQPNRRSARGLPSRRETFNTKRAPLVVDDPSGLNSPSPL